MRIGLAALVLGCGTPSEPATTPTDVADEPVPTTDDGGGTTLDIPPVPEGCLLVLLEEFAFDELQKTLTYSYDADDHVIQVDQDYDVDGIADYVDSYTWSGDEVVERWMRGYDVSGNVLSTQHWLYVDNYPVIQEDDYEADGDVDWIVEYLDGVRPARVEGDGLGCQRLAQPDRALALRRLGFPRRVHHGPRGQRDPQRPVGVHE